MNSKWQMHRAGLVDFWYYDEEEFYFTDGRMLLRGANGSGKSVTMQSFIPLLLDGNMRPERLDPFGSRARKMENYLLEEGDGREERTGYLYLELKRKESGEYVTIGIGLRARRNKKLESWYFCITDGRRIGKDFRLYRDSSHKIVCSKKELKNRIAEGGRVMETQSEYAQCVNRLLFGFETQEEYKELLELLIQLRTPKLSKDFKPTVINEILSSSLQTLSEDDLRPMSEAIENMDNLRTNLESLRESIRAARQIEKIYDQYNRIVLYDKAAIFYDTVKTLEKLEETQQQLQKRLLDGTKEVEEEKARYEALCQEEKVLSDERDSLTDSDAARLKKEELACEEEIRELQGICEKKEKQESEKRGKRRETELCVKNQEQKNEASWEEIKNKLDEMEEAIGEIPFDDFAFLKQELLENREESYSFEAHGQLLNTYRQNVQRAAGLLGEEKISLEKYSRLLEELDRYQEERNSAERESMQYENQLHETRQELIESISQWEQTNRQLHPQREHLQEVFRRIESYQTETDYWEIRGLCRPDYEKREKEITRDIGENNEKLRRLQQEYHDLCTEKKQWEALKDPEPERDPAVIENRKRLQNENIPYMPFYKAVDFAEQLSAEEAARLEEALYRMGILDALIVPEQYRQRVLEMGTDACDTYIFTDVSAAAKGIEGILQADGCEDDILLYQNISRALAAISVQRTKSGQGTWIGEDGNFGIGLLEGNLTGTYEACFIGASARERFRQRKLEQMEEQCRELELSIAQQSAYVDELENCRKDLESEWAAFPMDGDLKIAARDLERLAYKMELLAEKIRAQKQLAEAERSSLDEIRLKVQEACRKCYLPARLDTVSEAQQSLAVYQEVFTKLQLAYGVYESGRHALQMQEEYLENIDADLDEIRYDLNRTVRKKREQEAVLDSVRIQLALTDYDKIRERLDYCTTRLQKLPGERESSVRRQADLRNTVKWTQEELERNSADQEKAKIREEHFREVFEREYALGYVYDEDTASAGQRAAAVCSQLAGSFRNKKQSDLFGSLQEVYHQNKGALQEYKITMQTLFGEEDDGIQEFELPEKRLDISAKYRGVTVKFKELLSGMQTDAGIQEKILSDKDRELFEEILANTISKKIRARIQASRRWVDKMNALMESMRTSSGLKLSLRWKNKRAEKEEQLDTGALVALLQKDAEIMTPAETAQLSAHFRSKISEARNAAGEEGNIRSFHAVMREVLDYRQWFEFQLECEKTGEKKRELTDRVFFTFSGGEKAMAMYVPLFSAVVAKYAGARADAPRLISLDEAFAGVDEMNIRDMFRLMVEFDFNFMINSQILWGDYDTVPGLSIYQLLRPENARYVTVIRYTWNGTRKEMVTNEM